jgi:hypothetical protein
MRFILLVKATPESEAGVPPPPDTIVALARYDEELVRAGVLLAAEGLRDSSRGKRVSFQGGRASVTDGPFPEVGELVARFWLIQVRSPEEALAWATRAPFDEGVVELRQVLEAGRSAGT